MMSTQDLWTASLLIPALVLGIIGAVASRRGRTSLGLSLRHGAVAEFLAGCGFSLPFVLVLLGLMDLTGLVDGPEWVGGWASAAGIAVYFLALFLLEEIAFRALLMTGLGVLIGPSSAWVITAVAVAGAYAFAPHTGVLPVAGAIITNLLTGLARWRTGRIWWGFGQRWLWNTAIVALGFTDSGFALQDGLMHQRLAGPSWLTGGAFGVEGGVVGIVFLLVMLVGVACFARGRTGPWRITAASTPSAQSAPSAPTAAGPRSARS
jgi:membrane protease YdiL (CAAX protease family)